MRFLRRSAAPQPSPNIVAAIRGAVIAVLVLSGASRGAVDAAPQVGVYESPTATEWLRSAGVECRAISETDLPNSLTEVQVLVLPLDRIRSEAPLRALSAFTARGGKVLAIYWGTIARPGDQNAYPVYTLAPALGVRVQGWTMTGPAIVQPESSGATAAGSLETIRGEVHAGSQLALSRCMLVQVEAGPGTQVLAHLVPAGGAGPLVLAVRNGNMLYAAADLFQSGVGSAENRRLFFWLIDQAVPGLAFARVRERAGAAVAAVIRARAQLSTATAPAADAARRLLDEADAAASRAKLLAAQERFADSLAAADQSQQITRRVLGMLEGH